MKTSSFQIMAWTLGAIGCTGAALGGPVWSLDPAGSSLDFQGNAFADDYNNGTPLPSDTQSASVFVLTSNYTTPGGDLFQYGAEINPRAKDSTPLPSITTGSSGGYIGINGVGSDTLTVKFRVATLNDTFNCDGFRATSFIRLLAGLKVGIDLNGSASGNYDLNNSWSYFIAGGAAPEGVTDDSSNTSGGASGNFGAGNIFFFSDAQGGITKVTRSDTGIGTNSVNVPNGGLAGTLSITGQVVTDMNSPGKGPANEDLEGGEFLGTLQLQIVPTPAGGGLLLLGGLAAARRRR